MLGRALRALERAVFDPARLPAPVVTAVAVAPSVIAGLVFFQVGALASLLLALATGGVLHLAARRARLPTGASPVLSALFAVALAGPATAPVWVMVLAFLAGTLELGRARFLPGARIETGLAALAIAFALDSAAVGGFVQPGTGRALAEPVRLWAIFGGGSAAPIDPVRLYVGNVPGPLFATSLMAVVVGATWLWYAGRLSVVVLLTFAAAASMTAFLERWNTAYHLDSGPAWFVAALVLADRRRLPASRVARVLVGFAAGLLTLAPRAAGAGIEAAFGSAVALQAVIALVEGIGWLGRHRREVAAGLRIRRPGPGRHGPRPRAA